MRLGRNEWGLALMKTKEWVPGNEGHREESGPKRNADPGQITWSSMFISFLVYAWCGYGGREGRPRAGLQV